MSRVVYFDCRFGVAGDMLLGALVDLGLPLTDLRAALASMELEGYRLQAGAVRRAGLQATKVDVILEDAGAAHSTSGHGDHHHDHDHDHQHHHAHRGLADIRHLIQHSELPSQVKSRATELFARLAEAEAAVHGTSPEAVHFHEVGAVDSIVDIVGAVFGLEWLGAERFVASPLNVGSGTVTMEHGTFPVPAPATTRLLVGASVFAEGEGELTTPTGALLVTSYAQEYGPLPAMRPLKAGYGAGTHDPKSRPNVVRLVLGEAIDRVGAGGQVVLALETEIDDMAPQLCAPVLGRLLEAGALDAFFTPVVMKKGRPGFLLTVLLDPERRTAVEEVLFTETTTIGVRYQEWTRTCLDRSHVTVDTAFGPLRVKIARLDGRVVNAQPEFDDCERAARKNGSPVKEVWLAAVRALRPASLATQEEEQGS